MPYIERDIQKKYYSIGEVARLLKVNTSLIRFWEGKFEVINPKKNKKGKRKYTLVDIEIIKSIYNLVKEKGFTLEGANAKIKSEKKKNLKEDVNIVNSLLKIKNSMKNLRDSL